MAESKIEWTGRVWTPIVGCTPVSPACANCYAAPMAARLEAMGRAKYAGLATREGARGKWTGKVTLWEPEVRVQHLQEVSEADARAEGAEPCVNGWWFDRNPNLAGSDARGAFYCLWNSPHTHPGERWEDNPAIVAITFEVHRRNVDAMGAAA